MKRRTAVFGLASWAMPGLVTRAFAADDALSIANNQKFLDDCAKQRDANGQPFFIKRPSGLMFHIIQNGYGKRPSPTDSVKVYYTGKLINGVVFDGTSPGLPATFKLTGGLVTGWVEALKLMREGDHWQLVIPPILGYGVAGSPSDGGGQLIPPNQDLIFDLKLISTTPAPKKGEPGYVPDPGDKDDQEEQ
jgi:FKBP-type peptidyl-prolyl cis-trans isomerase